MDNTKTIFKRSVRVRLADLPGSLHRLTGLVSGAGVNIVRLELVSRVASPYVTVRDISVA